MEHIGDVTATERRFPNVVLTIGSFDGVHRGHMKIVNRVVATARERGGTAALMTLRPHPRKLFDPGNAPKTLTAPGKQAEVLNAAGIDVLYVLPFTHEIAKLDRETFVERIVVGQCAAQHVVVGHDFAFGKGAKGDFAFLQSVAERYGFSVEQIPPFFVDGERVSSSAVRKAVCAADFASAERMLGRRFSMLGTVQRGRGMGHTLGFPTANIPLGDNIVPPNGIYAAEAVVNGTTYAAAVNVGIAPTIPHDRCVIEAHLLDFSGDLSGTQLELIFHERLRDEAKYESLDALTEAIAADVAQVRARFAESA